MLQRTLLAGLPSGSEWLHEIKHDGTHDGAPRRIRHPVATARWLLRRERVAMTRIALALALSSAAAAQTTTFRDATGRVTGKARTNAPRGTHADARLCQEP
jgi:hypothetical protein